MAKQKIEEKAKETELRGQSDLASISDKIEVIYTLHNGVKVCKLIKDRYGDEEW